ncbi:MAG: hypothetical protein ACE1ZF_02390, partial [Gemmatimonadales bacterium]
PREDTGVKDLDALIAYLQGAPQPFAIPTGRRIVQVRDIRFEILDSRLADALCPRAPTNLTSSI